MKVDLHEPTPFAIDEYPKDDDLAFVTVSIADASLSRLVVFSHDPDALRRLAEHFGSAADRLTVLLQEPAA